MNKRPPNQPDFAIKVIIVIVIIVFIISVIMALLGPAMGSPQGPFLRNL